jgi:hypothetical protein
MEMLTQHIIPRNFNTDQHLHTMGEGHMAFYEEEKHGAKIDKVLEVAHKNNIREIIYMNVHCFVKRFYDQHPEWVQLDREGKPVMAYDLYYFNCINSSWFEFFEQNIKKLCSHDIDGIFLDGPVVAQNACYCQSCQDKFSGKYGKSVFDATREEWLEFRVDSVTEYIKKTNQIVKSINPNIMLYLNNSALRADVTGSNTRKVEPYVDMLGAEGGFVWVNKTTSLWHAGSMAKAIENQAKGKPTVIFIAGDHKPYSYYLHTAAETKILYAQSIANGANVWYGIHAPIYVMSAPGGQAAIEMNNFFAANEGLYRKTKPVSKVALMWSQESANFYSSSVATTDFTQSQHVGLETKRGNHYKAFMGFYEMLERAHVQFDVIDEFNAIDGSLSKYELVVLPTCACMNKDAAEGIKKYVSSGGNLLSTFDTGYYDGKGNYLGQSQLKDILGMEAVEGVVDYKMTGVNFQRFQKADWITEGLSAELIPSPSLAVRFIPSEGATVLGKFLEPMKGRYVALPTEGYPGMVMNNYGKGTSVYIGGTFGEDFDSSTNADFITLTANIVNKLSTSVLKTNAPGSVELVLRYQPSTDKYILHAINMTGEMVRPIKKIIPIKDVKVTIKINKKVSSVKSVSSAEPVEYVQKDDLLELSIPIVNEYEVIVIE